jgi:hypothetical protein
MNSETLGASWQPAGDAVDDLRIARSEIVQLQFIISRLGRELAAIELNISGVEAHARRDRQQLRVIRRSISWRVTLPLRIFRRRLRRFAAPRDTVGT